MCRVRPFQLKMSARNKLILQLALNQEINEDNFSDDVDLTFATLTPVPIPGKVIKQIINYWVNSRN